MATLGAEPTPSVELAVKQNDQVEGDLLFYKDLIVWHMIDRADRWHAAIQVDDKSTGALCEAISKCWLQTFGPFKVLVVDGESGLFSTGANDFFQRHGIEVRPRAPGQHARMVERRGAILRHALHCIEEQLQRDEVTVSFSQLLAEAVFSGNALVT